MPNAIAEAEVRKKETLSSVKPQNSEGASLYASVDVHNCQPEIIRNKETIKQYVRQLSDILNMKCVGAVEFIEDEVENGTDCCSMTQFVDSSLITGHFAYKSNTAYIDIFSSKYYDPEVISHFTLSFFRGSTYNLKVTVRK